MVQKDIIQVNPESNVAICTLWSKKENILKKLLKKEKISTIGTLYTSYGINYLLQTLGKNPKINKVILYGADLSTSGKDIINLFGRGERKFNMVFEENEIKDIINSVDILDLREEYKKNQIEKLEEVIEKNYSEGLFRKEKNLKISEVEVPSYPLPIIGNLVWDDSSIFRPWLKVLNQIFYNGFEKPSEYGELQKELLNMVVSIGLYGKTYELEEDFFEYIKREEFEEHVREVTGPEKPKDIEYTYGSRAFSHEIAGNQIEKIIDYLAKKPYTRRALTVLWDHKNDFGNKFPPCIDLYQGLISGDYYNHTVYLRSNDMEKGWPVNMYGQIRLAEYIKNKINEVARTDYKLGIVTLISCSAHLYEHSWKTVKDILEKHESRLYDFVPDPRGNYIIYHNEDKDSVIIENRTQEQELIKKISKKSLNEAIKEIRKSAVLSDHAVYLGKEITKAFEKLKRKEDYVQDRV